MDGRLQRIKNSVFKNICIRVNGALKNTHSTKQTCIAINKNFSRFLSLYHKYWMKLILAQFFQWIEEREVKVWGWDFVLLAGMCVNTLIKFSVLFNIQTESTMNLHHE